MGKSKLALVESDASHSDDASLVIISTLLDTTWRLVVPSIGLTVAGVIADNVFNTKPWLTVAGVMLGVFISGALVYQQLRKVKAA